MILQAGSMVRAQSNGGPSLAGVPDPSLACWIQAPDFTTPVDIVAAAGTDTQVAAADFIACSNSITDIYIWGSWLGDQVDPNATMSLSLWLNQPATNGVPAHPLPQFGGPTYNAVFGPGPSAFSGAYSYSLVGTNSSQEMFLDPSDTNVVGTAGLVYLYHFAIPVSQQPLLNPGQTYWLSLSLTATNVFGWQSCVTNEHYLDDAMYNTVAMPSSTPWGDLRYPPASPLRPAGMSLAFALVSRRVDEFPISVAAMSLVWPGSVRPTGNPETVILVGKTDVFSGVGPNGQTAEKSRGMDQARSEMVAMNLNGTSSLGPVNVQVRPPDSPPFALSAGLITEDTNSLPGILDLPGFGGRGTANSFFDMNYQIGLANASLGNPVFYNSTPRHMTAVISDLPPGQSQYGGRNTYSSFTPTDLNEDNEDLLARILTTAQVPNPPTDGTPVILFQPVAVSAIQGAPARFSVTAAAVNLAGQLQPLTYQWQQMRPGGTAFANILYATNSSYTTSALQTTDNGTQYQVTVRSAAGSPVTSTPVSVRVGAPQLTASMDPNGNLAINSSDPTTVLQAADSGQGPYENVGYGPLYGITPDAPGQFFRGALNPGGGFGTISGTLTDPMGNPLSGLTVGLQNGGPGTVTDNNGNFVIEGAPAGICVIRISAVFLVVTDDGTIYRVTIGINIEVTVTANGNSVVKLKVSLSVEKVPCNCTPWCAIAEGTINGVQTPVYYSGGANPPPVGPANCGNPTVTVTDPNNNVRPLVPGVGRHQNSGPAPANGVWKVTTTVCGKSKTCDISIP
jgi:hypothetical protein